jgi:hypothetical protein
MFRDAAFRAQSVRTAVANRRPLASGGTAGYFCSVKSRIVTRGDRNPLEVLVEQEEIDERIADRCRSVAEAIADVPIPPASTSLLVTTRQVSVTKSVES